MSEAVSTPPQRSTRALAPDLARGVMLLFIAFANVSWYLWGHPTVASSLHPADGTGLDRALQVAMTILVDMRIYPMFAFLFGYGMVQFTNSRLAAGLTRKQTRRMLRRRHWAMILFGLVHAALLFVGDILGAYGLTGLILVAIFFERKDKTLRIWVTVFVCLIAASAAMTLIGGLLTTPDQAGAGVGFGLGDGRNQISGQHDYLAAVVSRLAMWVLMVFAQGLFMPAIPICVMLGWLAARHRLLEDADRHRRALVTIAAVGIPLGWLGGLPHALHLVKVIPDEQAPWMFMGVAQFSGMLAGVGYAALVALVAASLSHGGAAVRAVAAVGKRSLSCYLFQSVVFAPLLCAWGLGVGAKINTAGALAIAAATWTLSLAAAYWMENRNMRGPAEMVLRRFTYGRDVIERSAVTSGAAAPRDTDCHDPHSAAS